MLSYGLYLKLCCGEQVGGSFYPFFVGVFCNSFARFFFKKVGQITAANVQPFGKGGKAQVAIQSGIDVKYRLLNGRGILVG